MRAIVLALALALVVGSQATLVPSFANDKTYEYSYEATLFGGLPEEGLAQPGLKIRSKVLIRNANNAFILKLSEPEILEYSGIWPKDDFIPAAKLTTALATQLTTPIKFEYDNGLVGKVHAPAGISETVLNIHRGILNVLHITVRKDNVYELQESSSQGKCKTHYFFSKDVKTANDLLTKTRDLSLCDQRIFKDIGLAYTHKCPECMATGKSLTGASTFNYVMKPSVQGSLIVNATGEELIQFSPFNILKGAAQMESRQRLHFLSIVNIPLEPVKDDYLDRGSLEYVFGSELLQTPIQLLKITNAEAQIVEILDHLVNFNVEHVHDDAPLKFIELIQVLRVVQFEKIEELYEKYKAKPDYRNWILNAVPAIGTHTAIRFLREKLGELTLAEAAQALMASVHMVTANIEAIKLFKDLPMHIRIRENPVLRRVVMLGYGTLVAKYCVENPSCSAELIKPIHELTISALKKAEVEELIICVKVLGNAGHSSSLKTLMKLLPSFGVSAAGLPHTVHIETALALRNIAKKEPRTVQQIAVQLFMDKTNHAELRKAAAIVLFETKLPMGLVTFLANAVLKEQSMQVASFVYSYMKAMSKSTTPDYASVAIACNVAVKLLSPKFDRLSHRYSRIFYLDKYHSPYMMGAAASAFYINEAATVLPKAIVAKARTYLAGAYADVLEIGVRTEGVQEALLKMKDQNSQRIDRIKQIVQALAGWKASPSSRPLGSVYVKLFGQEIAYVNIDKAVVDQIVEFAHGPASSSYGRMAFKALLSGVKMHLVKPMLVAEIRHIFPTTVGLPMELSFYTAGVTVASVKCQGTVTPPLPDDFKSSQLLNSDIRMTATVAPSVSFYTYAVMGVNTAFIQAALVSRAKVYTVLPARIQAKIDMVKGNFKFEFLPVQGIDKIVSAHVDTYAVARNVEDISAAKVTPILPDQICLERKEESSWKTSSSSISSNSSEIRFSSQHFVSQNEIIKAYKSKLCKEFETYGIKACTEIESHSAAFIRNTLLYAIIGRHSFSVQVAQASGPLIENIEIEIQVGDKAAEKILKAINLSEEEEVLEDKTVLMKLQKILIPRLKNSNSSNSSSSHSSASNPSSSSSSHPKSKTADVNRHVNKKSKRTSSSSSKLSVQSSSSSSDVSNRRSRSRSRSSSSSSSSSSQNRSNSSSSSSSRSSSSRSSSISKLDLADSYEMKFTRNQVHQGRSSASSFEAIYNKASYLAHTVNPYVTIILRAVRSDQKLQGHQITAYFNKQDRRVQIILTNLAESDNWRMRVDAVLLCDQKMVARLVWGKDRKQYQTDLTAETGSVAQKPAIRLKMSWRRIPRYMKRCARRLFNIMMHLPCEAGVKAVKAKNAPKEITVTVAVASDNALSFKMMTPKRTFSKRHIPLPFYLPVGETAAEIQFYPNSWLDKFSYILSKSTTAECAVLKDKILTFNKRSIKPELPHSCAQVLAQDCSQELKFLVLLKRDNAQDKNQINVKIADLDIDMYCENNAVELKVNRIPVQLSTQIYQHPMGQIHIRRRGEGIALHAPFYGLQEIYFDVNALKVQVVDWMKGQTCGLCGKADGEVRQELRMPSGYVTKSAVSYAHSWVQPGKSCRDSSGCLMKHKSVKLDKQILIEGQESKCYSVEPVFHCLPGCMPVRTTQVKIGFHCVPADTSLNRSEIQNSMFGKSVDVRETAEAHLACRCSVQCP